MVCLLEEFGLVLVATRLHFVSFSVFCILVPVRYCSTLTFASVLSVEPGLSSTPPTGICHRGQTEVGAPGTRLNTRMRTPVLIVKGFLFLSLSQCWTSLAHKKCAFGTDYNVKVALSQ